MVSTKELLVASVLLFGATPPIQSTAPEQELTAAPLSSIGSFVYLDIVDTIVLSAQLPSDDFVVPPYFGKEGLIGAHISVIYPHEHPNCTVSKIHELGKTIAITPLEYQTVHPPHWKGVEAVYILTFESPELDTIREKYGLPKMEHPYHLTLAIKKSTS